jgi:hypothetical protein
MAARALVALLVLAAGVQSAPARTARVLVRYSAASEDEGPTAGRVALPLVAGTVSRAVVWEAGCQLFSQAERAAPPSGADQFWTFTAEPAPDNPSAARVRYRHVGARPADAPETTRVLRIDAADAINLNELSARTDCRYDRVHLHAAAETVRPPAARSFATRPARPIGAWRR